MTDETDEPNFYESLSIEHALREQLLRARQRSENPPPAETWTPEEEGELQSELARIQFNPNHGNPDFPAQTVELHGEDVPIHAFNNFGMILSLADTLRSGEEPPAENTFEAQYAALADERKYLEISAALQEAYPAAYKRSLQLFRGWRQDKEVDISPADQEYILSQTYQAAAHIARSLDPDYPLNHLR